MKHSSKEYFINMEVLFRPTQDTQRSINFSSSDFRTPRRSSDPFEDGYGELYIRHLESPTRSPSKPNPISRHKKSKLIEDICKGHMLIRIQHKINPSKSYEIHSSARSHSVQTYNNNLIRVTGPEFPVRKILRLPARQRLIEKDMSFSKEEIELMNYPYKFMNTHRKSSPVSVTSIPESLRSLSPIVSRHLKCSPSIITSLHTPVNASSSFKGSQIGRLDVLGKSIRMPSSSPNKRIWRNSTVDSDYSDKI